MQPSLVIPGATEPDWGPANPGAAAKPKLTAKASRKRVTVSVPCATACIVQAKLIKRGKTIAKKRTTLGAPGTAKLSLKPKRLKRGREGHRAGDRHARRRHRDDPPEEDQPSVTLTDEMTTGSSGFSVAGSVSATPILSTTSWPEVTLPRSA